MSRTSKLDDHRKEIVADIKAGSSQRALAQKYSVARSTVQHWLDKNGLVVEDSPTHTGVAVRDVDVLQAELKDWRKAAKRTLEADVQAERVLREIHDAVQAAPPEFTPPSLDDIGDERPHSQMLLLSDTHAGEVVNPEAVNGLNEYNWEIFEERMSNILRSILSFQANRPYPITELHVQCLGDMVSGRNHEDLVESNEFPVADQAYRMGMVLGQFIEQLIPYFPKITVNGISGNHPRTTKKPAAKYVFDNFDWMAYKIAETYLHNYVKAGAVTCEFPRSGFQVAEIAGTKGLLWHGDGVRSSMPGVPWGGIVRRVNELSQQYSAAGIHLDWFACGHFHQANVVRRGRIFMNGSVKGTDEHVLKSYGGGEDPTQLLLTYDQAKSRLTDVSWINP